MSYDNVNRQKIKDWLFKYNINNYSINDDLTVDLFQSLMWSRDKSILENIPFVFGTVHGSFFCRDLGIESLYFSPKIVEGIFLLF